MNFSQGHSGTKVRYVNRACFLRKNTRILTKMGEIHELFVLALSLVWFAGATPDSGCRRLRGVELKGVSRHDLKPPKPPNIQNPHGCLLVLYFAEDKQKEGKVLSRTSETVKTTKTVMKATPLIKLNSTPPFLRHPDLFSESSKGVQIRT